MDFEKHIDELVVGKRVFEIGGLGNIDHYKKNNFEGFRHKRLKVLAKELYSGDIYKQGIECANNAGFDFFYFDVEVTRVENEIGCFDRILLLDVIEHLNNIGLFLNNIRHYMDDKSELIISTPNPMAINNILNVLFGRGLGTYSDHTVWIDEVNMMQLTRRYGYEINDINYFTFEAGVTDTFKQKVINSCGKINKYLHQNYLFILKIK